MGEVYNDVEKTMIELQRSTMCRTRRAFQQTMRQRFISEVERLSGRHVIAFLSSHSIGPDMAIELFMLTPATGERDPGVV